MTLVNEVLFLSPFFFSYPTPELEGCPNLTSLDIQVKKLRDNTLTTITDGARRMREEARDIVDTLPEIESWADKLKSLTEEVKTQQEKITWKLRECCLNSRVSLWKQTLVHTFLTLGKDLKTDLGLNEMCVVLPNGTASC